jgi:hypothetical protein
MMAWFLVGNAHMKKRLIEFTGSELSTCNGKSATLVFYAQN